MSIRLRSEEDLDEAKVVCKLAFPADVWPGDDHFYWLAFDTERGSAPGELVGMCSAKLLSGGGVFLSRAAVVQRAQGSGLHRRMIARRCQWATKEGAHFAITYVVHGNWKSLVNLLRYDFRLIDAPCRGANWFTLWRPLNGVVVSRDVLTAAARML